MFAACVISAVLVCGAVFAAPVKSVSVMSYAGDVKVTARGTDTPVACQPGMALEDGARLTTGEESYADITFDASGKNVVRVRENSQMVLKLEGADKIELIDGEVFAVLENLKRGETFRIKTPCATCGARGTAWDAKTGADVTEVLVLRGRVFVRGTNRDGSVMEGELLVDEGLATRVRKFERPEKIEKISEERLTKLEKDIEPLMRSVGAPAEKAVPAEKPEEPAKETGKAVSAGVEGGEKAAGPTLKKTAETEKEALAAEKEAAVERRENIEEKTETAAEEKAGTVEEKRSEKQERMQEKVEQRTETIEKKAEVREEQKEAVEEQKEEQKMEQTQQDTTNKGATSSTT
jgi:hypothetical protein